MKTSFGSLVCALLLLVGSASADPFTEDMFYTVFGGFPRVFKTTVSFDGAVTFTIAPSSVVSSGHGADGIAGNPNDSGSLLVGAQGAAVHRISKTGAGILQTVGTPAFASFHLEVADSTTMYSSGIPSGGVNRITLLAGGAMGAVTGLPALDLATGAPSSVTQVITTPFGDFYTSSGGGGFGTFGSLLIGGASVLTTPILLGLPAAHGGVYDPFTGTIFLFGDDHITQVSLLGVVLSDLDFAAAGMGFVNFDQGTVDGSGHLFAASNDGSLFMMDYSSTGLLTFAHPDSLTFLHSQLDDIAPLVGAGDTTNPIPEPGTFVLFGLALAGYTRHRRRRKAA
ncbi:MAG: PEP-CTERM sorting domain-containing protein [Planctomycetota bacterium]